MYSKIMKVISDKKIIEKEIDLEYPYYLYFQDEYCLNDELHKVNENKTIVVKNGINHNQIEVIETKKQYEYIINNNLTTKEHFLECYNNVLTEIQKEIK